MPIMAELSVKHDVLFTEAAGCPMFCQKHCSGSEVVACCHILYNKNRSRSRPSVTLKSNRRIIVVYIIIGALHFIFYVYFSAFLACPL